MSGIMRFPRSAVAGPRLGGSPAVTGTTGYPWEDGDILYAADLNAAFLPLSGGGTLTGGIHFSGLAGSSSDLSKHIDLHAGVTGFCVDAAGTLNYNVQAGDGHNFYAGGTFAGQIGATGINQAPIGATNPSTGSFTNLAASGTVSGAGFTNLLSAAPFLPLSGGSMSGGIHFSGGAGIDLGAATVVSSTDLSRHLNLYNGQFGLNVTSGGMNVVSSSGTNFFVGAVRVGVFTGTGLDAAVIGSAVPEAGTFTTVAFNATATGPTIRAGTGAATGTQPKGSIWLRTDGVAGSTLYVTQGAGTWAAVAGV